MPSEKHMVSWPENVYQWVEITKMVQCKYSVYVLYVHQDAWACGGRHSQHVDLYSLT